MFHLVRYFSIASLICMVIMAMGLGLLYRHIAESNLMVLGENKNAALAQVFANSLWEDYARHLDNLSALSADDIRAHPVTRQMKQDIINDASGLDVVKVKIYTLDGLTIFSTEERQIGADKSQHPDFLHARSGQRATELVFREVMQGFDGRINNRNLISSYIPIRNPDSMQIEGVFELYSDVTPLITQIDDTEKTIYLGVLSSLTLLYLVLFIIVKRADNIIKGHQAELKKQQKQTEYIALHDALTGLPNRILLRDRLAHAMKVSDRASTLVAILFIDLDRFKPINDSLGHAVGDELLKVIAHRLSAAVRDCDTVARIGGDEFVVVLENITNVADAEMIAKRILRSMAEAVIVQDSELYVTSSIGITYYPFDDDVNSIDDILDKADVAMYAVKKAGRNTFQAFSRDMSQESDLRARMEQQLRPALSNHEFELYFQPILNSHNRRIHALEALIRWNSPEFGRVSPMEFIPLLEESGYIKEVGLWIIEEAAKHIQQLHQQGFAPLKMNVNISPRQFKSRDFVKEVQHILHSYQLPHHTIIFEITESLLVDDINEAVDIMKALLASGIEFSIDDFGVGYSSLSYLKTIPVQSVKIDRNFIKDIKENNDDAAILEAIGALSRSLNLANVAEGIETREQYELVVSKNIDYVQGYLFARPMPFADLLREIGSTAEGVALKNLRDDF